MSSPVPTGMYFDDFIIGQAWRTPGRTIAEADIVNWAGFSGDFNPVHTDEEFAKDTGLGRRVFHGPGVFAIASGLAWTRLGLNDGTAMAFLGIQDWKMTRPVFAGDTIHVVQRIDELRASTSKPDRGVVTFYVQVLNQDQAVCQEGRWLLLWGRRPA